MFEFVGLGQDNPLLTDYRFFHEFLTSTAWAGQFGKDLSEELRKKLLEPEFGLQAMLTDTSGQALDARELELRIQIR